MQNFSWLVHARPAAPPAMSMPPTTSASSVVPVTTVTRAHVLQRSRRELNHFFMSWLPRPSSTLRSPRQHPVDDVAHLRFVLGLQRVMLFLFAVDLDFRVRREVRVDLLLAVRFAFVFLGDGF